MPVYVSGVWNSYRKCRLVLLEFIYTCSKRLHLDNDLAPILQVAQTISEDIAASIPFHLLRNPDKVLQQQQTNAAGKLDPNRSIGGLFILHPLHVVSGLGIVPMHSREMFREYLAWIGTVMGIGQARLLTSDVSCIPSHWCSLAFGKVSSLIQSNLWITDRVLDFQQSSSIPREYLVDGHVLIWLGTLISGQGEER